MFNTFGMDRVTEADCTLLILRERMSLSEAISRVRTKVLPGLLFELESKRLNQ